MASSLRREVLRTFKQLHKTRKIVFEDDTRALEMGRIRINDEYKKNKSLKEPQKISELLKLAKDVDHELRTTVVQAREVRPGVFEAKFREETVRLDNVPFSECGVEKAPKSTPDKCGNTVKIE